MDNLELLRIARFYAESFREICREPMPDVARALIGIIPEEEDPGLLTAATLYTPVVYLMPAEDFIAKTYDKDIFNLLMETTYDPALTRLQRNRAIRARLNGMSRRARILQLAVLQAYLPIELVLAEEEEGGAMGYCRWLEPVAASLRGDCPALHDRLQADLHGLMSGR